MEMLTMTPQNDAHAKTDLDQEKIKIEREKMEIEREKIRLENEKLAIERSKTKWTVASIFIPLLIGALSIAYSAYSQVQQARYDFELKVAELVMSSENPTGSMNRARAIQALFPERLPDKFAASFDPKLYSVPKTSDSSKKELLKLIVEHPDQKQEIIELWSLLFPGDDWILDIKEK
jgi:hypothetical protein